MTAVLVFLTAAGLPFIFTRVRDEPVCTVAYGVLAGLVIGFHADEGLIYKALFAVVSVPFAAIVAGGLVRDARGACRSSRRAR